MRDASKRSNPNVFLLNTRKGLGEHANRTTGRRSRDDSCAGSGKYSSHVGSTADPDRVSEVSRPDSDDALPHTATPLDFSRIQNIGNTFHDKGETVSMVR